MLGLLAGWGLLRLRPGWRKFTMVTSAIGVFVAPIAGAVGWGGKDVVPVRLFGGVLASVPGWLILVGGVVVAALCLWMFRVLNRPEVRVLFERSANPP